MIISLFTQTYYLHDYVIKLRLNIIIIINVSFVWICPIQQTTPLYILNDFRKTAWKPLIYPLVPKLEALETYSPVKLSEDILEVAVSRRSTK